MTLWKQLKSLLDIRFWKFILIGVVNTLIGSAIMFGLYNLAGQSYWFSTAANYLLTSILSFFLNKHFTFQNKDRSWRPVLRFSLNILVCYLLAYGIAKPAVLWAMSGFSAVLQENAAMLVGMVLFTGFNYIGQRFFAFAGRQNGIS